MPASKHVPSPLANPEPLLRRYAALAELPNLLLRALSEGKSLRELAEQLCHFAEDLVPNRLASIMQLEEDGLLHVLAAPSADASLINRLDGLAPGPHSGSCGNVIHLQTPVYVAQAQQDERWKNLHVLARDAQIHSCWSYPVAQGDRIVGTFALTGSAPGLPDDDIQALLQFLAAEAGLLLAFSYHRHLQAKQQERIRLLAAFAESTTQGMVFTDPQGNVQWVNAAFEQLTGYTAGELTGKNPRILQGKESSPTARQKMHDALAAERGFATQILNYRKDGTPYWVDLRCDPLRGPNGTLRGYIAMETDISQRRRDEASLQEKAVLLDSLQEAYFVSDAAGCIRDVNAAFVNVTGYHACEAIGQTPRLLKSGLHDTAFYEAFWTSLQREGRWQGEIWNRRKNGEIYPQYLRIASLQGAHGEPLRYLAIFHDISAEKAHEEQLNFIAYHDAVTGLPNRFALDRQLPAALTLAQQQERLLAICLLDLENLASVNELHGRAGGDAILCATAQRLAKLLGAEDFLARVGGDEFCLLLQGIDSCAQLDTILQRVAAELGRDMPLPDNSMVSTRPRLGLTIYPLDDANDHQLLRHADLALYQAEHGSAAPEDWYQLFQKSWEERLVDPDASVGRIATLLDAEHVVLHFQPIVNLATGEVEEVEALARLRDAEALLMPADFLPRLGLDAKHRLSLLVCEAAIAQTAAWHREGLCVGVSVNFLPHSILHPELPTQINAFLARHGLPAEFLILEILEESDFLSLPDAHARLLNLKNLGVRIALDDLGTAYASLMRLKELPLDIVKLDRSFVRELQTRPSDLRFAEAVQRLTEGLGVKLIAEGVESTAVLHALAILELPFVQGYVYSAPLPPAQLAPLLRPGFPTPPSKISPGQWLAAYAAHMRWMGDNISLLRRDYRHISVASLASTESCPLHAVFSGDATLTTLHDQEHELMADIAAGKRPWQTDTEATVTELRNAIERRLEELARDHH